MKPFTGFLGYKSLGNQKNVFLIVYILIITQLLEKCVGNFLKHCLIWYLAVEIQQSWPDKRMVYCNQMCRSLLSSILNQRICSFFLSWTISATLCSALRGAWMESTAPIGVFRWNSMQTLMSFSLKTRDGVYGQLKTWLRKPFESFQCSVNVFLAFCLKKRYKSVVVLLHVTYSTGLLHGS